MTSSTKNSFQSRFQSHPDTEELTGYSLIVLPCDQLSGTHRSDWDDAARVALEGTAEVAVDEGLLRKVLSLIQEERPEYARTTFRQAHRIQEFAVPSVLRSGVFSWRPHKGNAPDFAHDAGQPSRRWRARQHIDALVAGFIGRAVHLQEQGFTDTALDLIYDSVDELLHGARFALCDSVLQETDTSQCSIDVLLALLTATLPAKSRLATRTKFFQRVETSLRERGEYSADVLSGLE